LVVITDLKSKFSKEVYKMVDLNRAQAYMRENCIDAWLIYDFRGNNPVMWQVIGGRKSTTRRSFLLIPSNGEAIILAHIVDREQFLNANFPLQFYASWSEMHDRIKEVLRGFNRIAMEYSPGGVIPTMSWVDGGTLEMIRSFGIEVVSSANIFQIAVAAWDKTGLDSHLRVSREVADVKDAAFDFIRRTIQAGTPLTEYDVQEFIMREFQRRNLETEDRAIVAVNENSSNPHYEPSPQIHLPIRIADWVLIDLWARYPGDHNVFADITWVGYVGKEVSSKYQTIFDIVKTARDLVLARLKEAWNKGENIQGWQLDVVARDYISKAGYGKQFVHRTGHSLGPGSSLHALGVNLDNFETHDTRNILPGVGFSVEPGIYLPEFGVRLEVNVYIDPSKGPIVTTPLQEEIVRLV